MTLRLQPTAWLRHLTATSLLLLKTGFVLDDVTKELISTGTEAQRAAAIVKVLDSTYKGFNRSLRDTPAGQFHNLS
jgi:hypothetical protein